jgi:ferritin
LPGFAKFFKHNSDEEREHAEKFMKFQNKRGGSVVLQNIQRAESDSWGTGLDCCSSCHNNECGAHLNLSLFSFSFLFLF